MRCPNCGREIMEDAKFCPFCGAGVAVGEADPGNAEKGMNTDTREQTGRVTRGEDGVYRWLYEYKMFSKCSPRRRYNAIRLSEGLMQNQIYAADEDYDFVLDYITRHIPEKARR